MYQPEWQQLSLEFACKPSSDGKKQARSKRLKHPMVSADTTSTQLSLLDLLMKEPSSSTLVFPGIVRNLTLNDKLVFLSLSSPKANLSKKLGQDSTTKGKSFSPYWNEFCQAMSDYLLLDTRIDFQGLASTSSSGCATSLIVKSWFSTKQTCLQREKWLKTSLQSFTSSVIDSMVSGSINKPLETMTVCKQYRLILTPPQESLLKKWVRLSRLCYNQAIAYLNANQGFDRTLYKGSGKQAFRSWFKVNLRTPEIKAEFPARILENTLMEAYSAWAKTAPAMKYIGKGKNKTTNPHAGKKMAKFRSVRDLSQTLQFSVGDLKDGYLLPKCWKKVTLDRLVALNNKKTSIPESNRAVEVTYKYGRFTLSIPTDIPKHPGAKDGIIAFDPGVRTFLTGFDGQSFLEFGNGDINRVVRLCQYLDQLQSRMGLSRGHALRRQRYRLRKQASRLRRRIRNLIDEAHRKIASFTAQNYTFVCVPTYETSQMVFRQGRKLKSKTARAMLNWGFYRFTNVLENQCAKYGTILIRHTEEYTSKTCVRCGKIHHKLGGNKKFKCPTCKFTISRDFNGAFGNFLKALWDTTSLVQITEQGAMFSTLGINVQ